MKKLNVHCSEHSRSAVISKSLFTPIILTVLILSACTSAATPTALPTVSLDGGSNNSNNSQTSDLDSVSASAIIVPVKNVELAFPSVGRVTAVNVNVGDQVTTGQTLVTLDTTVLEARVKEAEANLLAAQVDRRYKERLRLDNIHLEVADAEIARMQALLDSAKAVLATQSSMTAPFDGTIVSTDIAPGETVVPGATVIVLGDLTSYKIETTDLSERDVTRIAIGQPASVFIEALGSEFSAKVTEIARSSTTLGGDVVFKVTLELDEQPDGLLWGMSADVNVQTAQ
jgi:RND family efflux transporter MFP subunit